METSSKTIPTELEKYFETTSSCPLCGGANLVGLFEVNKLHFFECKSCHFRFMNPHLSNEVMMILYENSEILVQINPALEKYYEYQTDQKMNHTIMDQQMVLGFAGKNLPTSANKPKLFEVGYGNGNFLLEAIRYGWEVDGIETSKQVRQGILLTPC